MYLSFLDNSLLENKTYGLNTTDDTYPVGFEHHVVRDAVDLIKARIIVCNADEYAPRYIDVSHLEIEVNGEKLMEIIWD